MPTDEEIKNAYIMGKKDANEEWEWRIRKVMDKLREGVVKEKKVLNNADVPTPIRDGQIDILDDTLNSFLKEVGE